MNKLKRYVNAFLFPKLRLCGFLYVITTPLILNQISGALDLILIFKKFGSCDNLMKAISLL